MATRAAKAKARLFARGNRVCYLCSVDLTWETATVEHVVPRSAGGGWEDANLRLACGPCNNKKGASPAVGAEHREHDSVQWVNGEYRCMGCARPWPIRSVS